MPGLWWETAAERLAAHFPMRHADATAESVSAAARAPRGVPSGDVRLAARARRHQPQGMQEGRSSRRGTDHEWRGTCAALARHALTCGNAARVAHGRKSCRAPCRALTCGACRWRRR